MPFGGGLRGRNGRIHHGSTRKRRSSGPREAHMPELKPLLNIQKCTFHSHFETQTTSPPVEQAKNLSFTPKMMESRPRLNNPLFLNLRTNSFQLGEDDGELPWGHPQSLNKAKEGSKGDPKNPKYGHGQSIPQADSGDHH